MPMLYPRYIDGYFYETKHNDTMFLFQIVNWKMVPGFTPKRNGTQTSPKFVLQHLVPTKIMHGRYCWEGLINNTLKLLSISHVRFPNTPSILLISGALLSWSQPQYITKQSYAKS